MGYLCFCGKVCWLVVCCCLMGKGVVFLVSCVCVCLSKDVGEWDGYVASFEVCGV